MFFFLFHYCVFLLPASSSYSDHRVVVCGLDWFQRGHSASLTTSGSGRQIGSHSLPSALRAYLLSCGPSTIRLQPGHQSCIFNARCQGATLSVNQSGAKEVRYSRLQAELTLQPRLARLLSWANEAEPGGLSKVHPQRTSLQLEEAQSHLATAIPLSGPEIPLLLSSSASPVGSLFSDTGPLSLCFPLSHLSLLEGARQM